MKSFIKGITDVAKNAVTMFEKAALVCGLSESDSSGNGASLARFRESLSGRWIHVYRSRTRRNKGTRYSAHAKRRYEQGVNQSMVRAEILAALALIPAFYSDIKQAGWLQGETGDNVTFVTTLVGYGVIVCWAYRVIWCEITPAKVKKL
jgi:hypothetical protein